MNLQEDINRIKEVMGVISEDETEPIFNFNRTVYVPDRKAIVGAYMITNEDDKNIQVLNLKEIPDEKIFMDNAISFGVTVHKVNLPKSQVKVLGQVDGMDGFYYIELPYWLFKKLDGQLDVKRLDGKKRLSVSYGQSRNDAYMRKIIDPDVIKYISTTNPDKAGMDSLKYMISRYKPKE